jgi:hypothetical protein|tara:strand:- start:2520 stop:3029 length:510 start_codon:yes stop_codon:yes gene_type:complete
MNIVNKSDFIASIVLFLTGIIFYFIIIPQEIILEDEAVIGPDLLPNICIILITFLSVLLFFRSINKVEIKQTKDTKKTDNSIYDPSTILNIRNGFSLIEIKRVFFLLLTILISILLFVYLDVLVASFFLIIGSCIVCGLRKIWVIMTLSTSLISLAYFLLYKVLGTAIG